MTTKRLHIETILYHGAGWHVSPYRYNNPRAAFEHSRQDWEPLGSPGWFYLAETQRRYDAVVAQHPLDDWYGYDGEYEIVSLDIEYEGWRKGEVRA